MDRDGRFYEDDNLRMPAAAPTILMDKKGKCARHYSKVAWELSQTFPFDLQIAVGLNEVRYIDGETSDDFLRRRVCLSSLTRMKNNDDHSCHGDAAGETAKRFT